MTAVLHQVRDRRRPVIEELSARERAEIDAACGRGEGWARALRASFLDGRRLRLGIDRAPAERRIAAAAGLAVADVEPALREAGRWCRARGLLLMGFQGWTTPGGAARGDRPEEDRRWLLAVG
jgi:hypothetical protein